MTDVHKTFSEKASLHRNISIFNAVYYEKDNPELTTLIDFDLATLPDDTQIPSEVTAELMPPHDITQGVSAAPTVVHTCAGVRSGTTPFIAIEALDLKMQGYRHYLCHDLESIFYVIIWHGVGYRPKTNIYPTESNRYNKDLKQRDILRGWSIGPLSEVTTMKVAFVYRPLGVLRSITHPLLARVAIRLVEVIRARGEASVLEDIRRFRLEMHAERQQNTQPEVQLPTSAVRNTSVVIYPKFAQAWGITGIVCGKSCCEV